MFAPASDPSVFGVCPHCGNSNGYLGIGRPSPDGGHHSPVMSRVFVCHEHAVFWRNAAADALRARSSEDVVRDGDAAAWKSNAELLATYTEVDAVHVGGKPTVGSGLNYQPVKG
jgi:hypothetical protein